MTGVQTCALPIWPEALQFTFAEPMKGISRMFIQANLDYGDYTRVEVFIDDFKYRKYVGATPGCWRCGRMGGDWCEVPKIAGR